MIAIAGAGIAGILLARLLAEQNETVDLYEREPRVGGVFHFMEKPDLLLQDTACYNWFSQRSHIVRTAFLPQFFVPLYTTVEWCEELLDHPLINLYTNAPLVYAEAFRQRYTTLIFCGELDRLFGYRYGYLTYSGEMPVRSTETLAICRRYCALAEHYNIRLFGMRPYHEATWIHQIWARAVCVVGASP